MSSPSKKKAKGSKKKKDSCLSKKEFFVPFLFLAAYFLLGVFHVFSPFYMTAHFAALFLVFVWILGVREKSFFSNMRKTHCFFAFSFFLLVMGGSCWGLPHDVDLRVWVTPPSYTGQLAVPLKAFFGKTTEVIAGSVIQISASEPVALQASFEGEEKELTSEDQDEGTLSFVVPDLMAERSVSLFVRNFWHRLGFWSLRLVPDYAPQIEVTEAPSITTRKTIRLAYKASDDFGIKSFYVRVSPKEKISEESIKVFLTVQSGKEIEDAIYADLTSLPWAGRPVFLQLVAVDSAGHEAQAKPVSLTLPTRAFKHPFARALIEVRQKLMASSSAEARHEAANVMAGIARQQGIFNKDLTSVLALRSGAVRLVINSDEEVIEKTVSLLWRSAFRLEEGMMGLTREKLSKAEAEMSAMLRLAPEQARVKSLFSSLAHAGDVYFSSLESEKLHESPVLQELAKVSLGESESSSREDFQVLLEELDLALKEKDASSVKIKLTSLKQLIENLPTTLPKLSPAQDRLAGQVASLHLVTRAQKALLEMTEKLLQVEEKGAKEKKKKENFVKKIRDDQKEILSALEKIILKTQLAQMETKESQRAMTEAIEFLSNGKLVTAQKLQAEALALLQNSLLILSDQMKQSLTALAPKTAKGQ